VSGCVHLAVTSLAVGALFGFVPLVMGFALQQRKFGLLGFILCAALGFLFGVRGASIAATGTAFTILVRWQRERRGKRGVST
jgi:hypothetical protein